MKTRMMVAGLVLSAFGMAGVASAADCVVHYTRTACQGQEAVSYKKCDGQQSCEKTKAVVDESACSAAALKSCDNDRLDITKYKVITATFGGKALIGGFDVTGKPDPAGNNFCAADRPDLNQCK